jgi:hypothetical protein
MNHFEIDIVDSVSEGGTPFKELRLLIDGQDIVSMLKRYEGPLAKREGSPNIAGAYSGLSATHTPRDSFLGVRDLDYGDAEDKVAVLECECGCEGCWPFAAKITVTDSSVRWSDFEQPHRTDDSVQPSWDYSDFGPFEFEKQQYLNEIDKLNGLAQQ